MDRTDHLRAPSHGADSIVSVRDVTKRFAGHTVLRDVTFDVPRGKTTAIMGPSGTGKSVLLKVIIGLLTPGRGRVLVDGEPMVGVRARTSSGFGASSGSSSKTRLFSGR